MQNFWLNLGTIPSGAKEKLGPFHLALFGPIPVSRLEGGLKKQNKAPRIKNFAKESCLEKPVFAGRFNA